MKTSVDDRVPRGRTTGMSIHLNTVPRLLFVVNLMFVPVIHTFACEYDNHGLGVLKIGFDQNQDLLSVNAEDQRVDTLLQAISKATGIEFSDDAGYGCDQVNVEFDAVPLLPALALVFSDRSYIVRKSSDGHLSVWLLPPGQDVPRSSDMDAENAAFYNDLKSSQLSEGLAQQVMQLEQEQQ
jgi:hypothetical protein